MAATRLAAYRAMWTSLSSFFGRPLTVEEGKALIRERLARREDLFLQMAREHFYAPESPYRALLALARCEYRDLELLVRQQGLESALAALRRDGVYLTFEEFKTGAEVRREGRIFRFTPAQFDNPAVAGVTAIRSGGSRSRGTWTPFNLEFHVAAHAPQLAVVLEAMAPPAAPVITWQLGFPSGAAVGSWFSLAKLRRPPRRWFSLTPIPRGFRGRHRLLFQAARLFARRAGLDLPMPEFAPVEAVGKVLDAIVAAQEEAGSCVVITTPSCAVRLAVEAQRRPLPLPGVLFYVGAEPLTPEKAEQVRRGGARVAARYAALEIGGSGAAPCGDPAGPDDMHFRSDVLALITSPRQFGDVSVNALMLTSLLPNAPKLLLNVELDDFAQVEERRCGCVWDTLGCRTHLMHVRSFTKLTGEGTTVLGSNVTHIIEQVLPAAFGGSAVDYQLVEAQDEDRLTRLYLLISWRVGPLDERAVLRRFLQALEATGGRPLGGRRQIWEQANSIRVLRRDPIPTGAGKLFPFHTLGAPLPLLPRGAESPGEAAHAP